MALKCALICFFKRGWIPYSEERRILRLDQRILPIHMYNLWSTRRRVCKGFPFTRSLPGICWLMIVEMMAHFSGILVREWLPNHGFFFFKRSSISSCWMNENKERTSPYPVAFELTKWEARRKAKLTSFSRKARSPSSILVYTEECCERGFKIASYCTSSFMSNFSSVFSK